ncbi:hypothetical protein BU15DRAFT_49298 [Melanogaster broomeanus]|nr:hypothetical protein BU15DRAFT_49298 [Melanogaster broomeanus]
MASTQYRRLSNNDTADDDERTTTPVFDDRFNRPPPPWWKRAALIAFLIFLFWLSYYMRRTPNVQPKVIHASRYSKEYKYRPAASPIITERLKDGRTRLRGAHPDTGY